MIRFINVPEGGRLKVRLLFDNSIDPAGFSFHGGNAAVMDGQAPPSISFTTEVLGREVVMTSSEIGLWPASIPYEIRVSRNSDNSSWLVLEGGINVETVAAGDAPLGEGVDGDAEAGDGVYVPEYDPQTVVLTVSEEEGRIVFGPYSGGGGEGGDVYKDLNNVFTGVNTFNNHAVKANAGVEVGEAGGEPAEHTIYRSGDDLYWGDTKLNCQGGGGGDVTRAGNNCFTGVNKFWNDCGVTLGNTAKTVGRSLKNQDNNLYWGDCKVVVSGTLDSYVTKTALAGCGYAKSSALDSYVTKTALSSCGYAKSSALNSYVTKTALAGCGYAKSSDLSGYVTKGELSGCGFVKQGCDNVFTGDNTFTGGSVFNTWAEFYGDTTFHKHVNIADGGSDLSSDARLQNHNGDLYWGSSKLNDQGGGGGGGDVYKDGDNVFTGTNDFQCGLYMTEGTGMECSKLSRDSDGNLYWGYTKLNGGGGGDVTAAGNNCFTGCNKFIKGLYIPVCSSTDTGKLSADSAGDLYWGTSKLNDQGGGGGGDVTRAGNNCFTGCNKFYNSHGVLLGTSASAKKCLKYSGGSLYWGTTKVVTSTVLSGCGFAREDVSNTFNSSNVFNSCVTVNGNVYVKCKLRRNACASVDLGSGLTISDSYDSPIAGLCYKLYRVGDDLYWRTSKLNDQGSGGGGGDVYANGNNMFTGVNKFYNTSGVLLGTSASAKKCLKYSSGGLYWGNDTVLTSADRTATPSSGSNNVITSGGVYTHTSDSDIHVTSSDKTTWNSHASNSGIHLGVGDKELIVNMVRMGGAITIRTQNPSSKGNHQWVTLDKKWVVPGLLTHVGIAKRDNAGTIVDNVYLMVFQMAEGGNPLSPKTWTYVGTSTNSVTADYGAGNLGWDFNGIDLAGGRPIAFKFTQDPAQTAWAPNLSIGLRLADHVDGDCTYVEGNTAFAPSYTQMTTLVNTFEYYKGLEARVKALEDKQ